MITDAAADAVASACATIIIDPTELAEASALAGTLAIPLVKRLRNAVGGEAANALHKGATSQDVADTVLMLQAKAAAHLLANDLDRIGATLGPLAERYAATPAVGRTLLQDAMPVGFGLRIAQWYAGIDNAARRLAVEVNANAKVQLDGAAGTRAGMGGKGATITTRMADALGLAAGVPWHAQRVGVAAIASAVGIVIGALGKLARDISLLSRNALGEAREPTVEGRGGSSAMAHKRNPTGCQVALSAAIRAPGLVASILSGLPQEEERGLGGWQAAFRVLRVDTRGHGASDAPEGDYSLVLFADDVAAVMDDAGIRRAAVAGVSPGGMIARWSWRSIIRRGSQPWRSSAPPRRWTAPRGTRGSPRYARKGRPRSRRWLSVASFRPSSWRDIPRPSTA